jgi:hypothetical protein
MHQSPVSGGLLAACGSSAATLALLALLALGITAGYVREDAGPIALGVPLALLAVNLVAAVATRPVFRRQLPLLVAHLALLALAALVAVGQLSRLQGRLTARCRGRAVAPFLSRARDLRQRRLRDRLRAGAQARQHAQPRALARRAGRGAFGGDR